MKSQRRRYSAEFKAKVALEALKGQKTINEIAARFQVHPNQVTLKERRLNMNKIRFFLTTTTLFVASCIFASYAAVPIPQTCVPAPPGMVSWWPGDGNAMDTVGGNHGTLQNGATFAAGMVGQSFNLDGFDDYIDTGTTVLGSTGPFTVDAWINTNGIGTYQSIVSEIGSENTVGQFQFRIDVTGILQFFRRSSPASAITLLNTNDQITPGVWAHVAAVFNGSDLKVYINGVEASGQIVPGNYGTIYPGTTKIGGADPVGSGQPGGYFFNGFLDEVEIYNRALSASEIQGIYLAGSAGKCKDADNDGVPDMQDDCPNSIVNPTVVIGGCDSGVPNTVFPNGCTISDRIAQCAAIAQNHDQFVSCVAHMTNELKKAGVITGQQKGAIQSCAAQANIP